MSYEISSASDIQWQFQNDLWYNAVSWKIEQGFPLTKNTDTPLSTFYRRWTWINDITEIDSRWWLNNYWFSWTIKQWMTDWNKYIFYRNWWNYIQAAWWASSDLRFAVWQTWFSNNSNLLFDSTWDLYLSNAQNVSATPNTTAWNNARFYVRGWASVFDNAWVDWNEIVEFKTDRSWSIYQRGIGAATSTQLMSNNTWLKQFKFSDNTNEDIAIIESRWDISQSAFVISKALKLNRQQVLWIAGWTIFAMTDDLVAVDVDTTAWAVTINLTPPWNHIWRHYRIYKYAWTNPITITTPSWWLIHMRWAWSSTSQTFNDSQKYSIILRCDTTNRFVEYSDTIETTRLISVPNQTRTIVWWNSAANARVTIEAAQVLIWSTTFTNTKSVPVWLSIVWNTYENWTNSATWSFSFKPRYTIAVWATLYLDQFRENWWFFTASAHNIRWVFKSVRIPVAAWATITIDFSASLQNVDASVVAAISWQIWFTEIEMLVVNQ